MFFQILYNYKSAQHKMLTTVNRAIENSYPGKEIYKTHPSYPYSDINDSFSFIETYIWRPLIIHVRLLPFFYAAVCGLYKDSLRSGLLYVYCLFIKSLTNSLASFGFLTSPQE